MLAACLLTVAGHRHEDAALRVRAAEVYKLR
jgi:hypothetical protein